MYNNIFQQLDNYLTDLQPFWQFEAFHYANYPWKLSHPALCDFLDEISDLTLQEYQQNSDLLFPKLKPFIESLHTFEDPLFAVVQLVTDDKKIPFWLKAGIKGRLISWQQQIQVTSIEWQKKLCDIGTKEVDKIGLKQTFKQADVLKGEADNCINADCHAIALHACGDFHLRLIKLAKVQQPMTGKRQARLSERDVLWRLAFDELQKQCLKSNDYFPLPSFPKILLSANFKDFVLWAKQEKSLSFIAPDNLQPFLDFVKNRLKKVRCMELISQLFVRPLELWLVYDRALALQESGYQVKLSTFCEATVTPRNLLIQAKIARSKYA